MRNFIWMTLLVPLAFSSSVRADEALVGVVLSTQQALVWDAVRHEYTVRRVGDSFAGGKITELGADHAVIERDGTTTQIELSAPPTERLFRRARRMAPMIIGLGTPLGAEAAVATAALPVAAVPLAAPPVAVPAVVPAPVAVPMATAASSPLPSAVMAAPVAPVLPPAPEAPAPVAATSVAAPLVAAPPVAAPPVAASPVAASPVAAPPVAAPPVPAPVASPEPTAEAAPAIAPVAAVPVAVAAPVTVSIPRDVFDRELGDFETLATQVQLTRAPKGGYRLDSLAEGCFLERIGLKAGDTVRRVDGRVINGPSDASAAYAWLHIADQFTLDIERGGQPLRLHYSIAR